VKCAQVTFELRLVKEVSRECLQFVSIVFFVCLGSRVAVVEAARHGRAEADQTGAKVREGLKLSSDCNFLPILVENGAASTRIDL